MKKKIDEKILRTYDIRGEYPTDITEETAYIVGRAFGSYAHALKESKVIVGYDNRKSSIPLHKEIIKGLIECGIEVHDIGLVTTPMVNYARCLFDLPCAIMVTASHNPTNDNGFKLFFHRKMSGSGATLKEFYEFLKKGSFISGKGNLIIKNIRREYMNNIKNSIHVLNKKIKVVVDCGNGTASLIAKDTFNKFDNLETIMLFDESNSDFPNHHPDPFVEENLRFLKQKVIATKADLGIGLDGDGDRVGIIDNKGNFIPVDKLLLIYWRDLMSKVDNKEAIFDVKCSKVLSDEITRLGGKPRIFKTGGALIRNEVNEHGYVLGGELAGHIVFNDRYQGFDDGMYAGLRLIEIMANTNKSIPELLEGINSYVSTPEIKIEVGETAKFKIVELVKKYVVKKNLNYIDIDGIRVEFIDGFALVRASNTGPHITTRFEASNEEQLHKYQKEYLDLIDYFKKQV